MDEIIIQRFSGITKIKSVPAIQEKKRIDYITTLKNKMSFYYESHDKDGSFNYNNFLMSIS